MAFYHCDDYWHRGYCSTFFCANVDSDQGPTNREHFWSKWFSIFPINLGSIRLGRPLVRDIHVVHRPAPVVEDIRIVHRPPPIVEDIRVVHHPRPIVRNIRVVSDCSSTDESRTIAGCCERAACIPSYTVDGLEGNRLLKRVGRHQAPKIRVFLIVFGHTKAWFI